jgi:serine/threonine-protein kinase
MLEPGTMVGEYRVTHKLGEGGMGVVFAGVHPVIGKRVAIKVLVAEAEHPELVQRFEEEARAVNKIGHPNIIDIFAFNKLPDGRDYFVMEYLDGESLAARLEQGPIELGELRRLLGQICSALAAAHKAGVVHRDLKPDNIWIARQGQTESRIKLLDFGIAKLTDRTNLKRTQTGVAIGTPAYMPPEQAMGRAIDQRTDIYALGVVMYQIFAGTLPFLGATWNEVVFKHATEPPQPPSRHRPIRPEAMEAIILACLEKDPQRRPQTAAELGSRIEAAFGGDAAGPIPERAPPVTPIAIGGTIPFPRRATERMEIDPGRAGAAARRARDRPAAARKLGPGRRTTVLIGVAVLGAGAGITTLLTSRPSRPPVDPPAAAPFVDRAPAVVPTVTVAPARPVEPEPTEGPAAVSGENEHRHKAAYVRPGGSKEIKTVRPGCDPDYFFDSDGEKHFKKECIHR